MKAEPDKRGLKKSGNKPTLLQQLRDAIVSEQQSLRVIETEPVLNVHPVNGQSSSQGTPNVEDIYSFIETKVRDVCRLVIENLS